MKKIVISLFLILGIVVVFFFYGTQTTVAKSEYLTVKQFDFPSKKNNDTLLVMSFNIGWLSGMTNNLPVNRTDELYQNNLNRIVDVLEKKRPNIIALQEIDIDANRSFNYNQPDSLAEKLRYKFGALAINWDKAYVPFPGYNPKYFFGKTVSSQCILSDLKISENSAEKLIKPINAPFYYNAFYLDRLIQKTIIETNRGNLMVLNVHLEAFDEETRNNHIKRVIEVFNTYRKIMPTLLVGDFNSPQLNKENRNKNLNRLFNLENVSNAISDSIYIRDRLKYNTFPSDNPSEKIDFIFYSSDKIRMIKGGVIQAIESPSDHSPIWMEFYISK